MERSSLPDHKPLERLTSKPKVLSQPQVNFPTKKLRMRSLLWVKPTGVAVPSTSSFLAQLCPTLIVNLAAISSGLGFGFSAIASPQLRRNAESSSDSYHDFKVDESEASWIAGMFGVGAVVGGLVSAIIATKLPRRKCLMLMTVPDVAGWTLIAASNNLGMLLAGRFLTGFSAAGYLHSILVYTAEISQPQHRGTLTSITIPSTALGTLVAYCLGSIAPWYFVAIVGCALPFLLVPGLLIVSNSPYWYLQQGEDKLAVQAMEKFRSSDANALSELLAIADIFNLRLDEDDNKSGGSWLTVARKTLERICMRKNRKPLLILNVLFFLALFSGHFAISFYVVDILRRAYTSVEGNYEGPLSSEFAAAIAIGAIKFAASLSFLPAMIYCRRKFLLMTSSIVMAVALGLLGMATNARGLDAAYFPSWAPLASAILYIAADSLGLGSLPYVYAAEFFPARMRSLLSGITISLSQLEMFVVVKTFPMLSTEIGEGKLYWIYAGVCLAAAVFTFFFVPETKGRSLEEIEKNFTFKESLHVSPYITPMNQRRSNRHPRQSIEFTL